MKRIAIIGANGAIGRAFVDHYQQQTEVEVTSITRSAHPELPNNQVIDFDNENSIEAIANLNKWNYVIVCIGILHDGNFPNPEKSMKQVSAEQLQHLYKINAIYPALIAKYFLPQMNQQERSIFACLSARVGSISDNHKGGWYSYRASKAALNMLLKDFAIEMAWKNKHAIVVGLHPGTVDSRLSEKFQANIPAEQLFTPAQSIAYLSQVIENVKSEDSGWCFDWAGKRIEP